MGKPTGFLDYQRRELSLRPAAERLKDWQELKTSSLEHKKELQEQPAAWIAARLFATAA